MTPFDMTPFDEDVPASFSEREVISRLRSAGEWAKSLSWSLEASDVMAGTVPALGARRGSRSGAPVKRGGPPVKRSGAPMKLRPRVVWAGLVAVAIATAVIVPQISGSVARSTSTTSSTLGLEGGGGPLSGAPCTTTVKGVTLNSKGDVIQLPIDPGPIISRAKAISVARALLARSGRTVGSGGVVAKLSSWTEVSAVYRAGSRVDTSAPLAYSPASHPWIPIWVVMLPTHPSGSHGSESTKWYMVAMDAATGSKSVTMQVGRTWFSSLSDRDPTLKGCPGGSSARLPFGVLTRDEEAYTIKEEQPPGTEAILKLTTVPALNQVDPGLYGGCASQNCSLDQLVWPRFLVYTAAPGHTLSCLPPSASYPPGYRPKQVKQYYTLSVAGSSEIGCGPVPPKLSGLEDLAPPGR